MITSILLTLALLFSFINQRLACLLGLGFLATGLYEATLEPLTIIFIALLGACVFLLESLNVKKTLKFFFFLFTIALTLFFFTHQIPGVHNFKIFDGIKFGPLSPPFTMYMNFDKPIFGFFFLLFYSQKIMAPVPWKLIIKWGLLMLGSLLLTLIPLGLASRFIAWDPKFSSYFLWFTWNNLLFTCIAEEVFFRGFVQNGLYENFKKKHFSNAGMLSVLIAGILFGIAHFPGGIVYVCLSTIAGIAYGSAFYFSRHIASAILCHFCLNALHFLLFTYPCAIS